jgi:3-phosphoshikimate 1-carboxyvinyltransferase
VNGSFPFHTPGKLQVEGDWSNAAFFLTATALGSKVTVENLDRDSSQGDRAIADLLVPEDKRPVISAADIPDLVPILAIVAGAKNCAVFSDIARLRLKESDRVASVCNMLNALGANTYADENTLTVAPGKYRSCTIDAVNDHRIAMSMAVSALRSDGEVLIRESECVAKSYPDFFEVLLSLRVEA